MGRVFSSTATGADVVVFSHDHCPPHVTAIHRVEMWVARVKFSFATAHIELWDVEPQIYAPRRRTLNTLLDEIESDLAQCRRRWWLIQETTCLDGRWVRNEGEPLSLLSRKRPGALQVATASYDVVTGEIHVHFRSGSSLRAAAGTGVEL